MKLGIVVVYIIDSDNEDLFKLHLSKLKETTKSPFNIYAGINRLPISFRHLVKDDLIKTPIIPTTETRDFKEHSYYLEALIKEAIADSCTHIAIFHMDSFPICDAWDKKLLNYLIENSLVAIRRDEESDFKPHSSFIFFTRQWYLEKSPKLLLDEDVVNSQEYNNYLNQYPHCRDSGWGYGFTLFRDNEKWHPLVRSNKAEDHFLVGSIYADMIFHLSAATRPDAFFRKNRLDNWKVAKDPTLRKQQSDLNKEAIKYVREQIIQDPEGYINFLRNGIS